MKSGKQSKYQKKKVQTFHAKQKSMTTYKFLINNKNADTG